MGHGLFSDLARTCRALSRGGPGRESARYAASEAGDPSVPADGSPFELVAVLLAVAVGPAMSVVTTSLSRGHDLCAGGLLRP